MDQKLKDLTEKLYNEGVSSGKQKAEIIIADANQKSSNIITEAKAEAQSIIDAAKLKAAELEKNTNTELQLASQQVINALKQEVVSVINGSVIEESVGVAVSDSEFVKKLILAAVSNWAQTQDLKVVVSPADLDGVEAFFSEKVRETLNKGLTINSINNVRAGFQIGPADGSYKVSFTQEDFVAFFQEFLRPKVVELLFHKK